MITFGTFYMYNLWKILRCTVFENFLVSFDASAGCIGDFPFPYQNNSLWANESYISNGWLTKVLIMLCFSLFIYRTGSLLKICQNILLRYYLDPYRCYPSDFNTCNRTWGRSYNFLTLLMTNTPRRGRQSHVTTQTLCIFLYRKGRFLKIGNSC